MSVQEHIASLQHELSDPDWLNKPNSWLRQLSAVHLSEIAIALVHKLVGGRRNSGRDLPYKIKTNDKRIDVKVATLGRITNYPSLAWRNIKTLGICSHLAFVAIYPKDARVFIVPIVDIPDDALSPIKGSTDHFQFVTTQAFDLPDWLLAHEIHGAA